MARVGSRRCLAIARIARFKMPLVAMTLITLLAGCTSSTPSQTTTAPPEPVPRPEARIDAIMAPVMVGLVPQFAEPGVAVGPDGAVYVTVSQDLALWRSLDAGRSFAQLGQDPCGASASACMGTPLSPSHWLHGGSDGSLVAMANGTLAWVGLEVPHNLDRSYGVPFQISRDHGATWSQPVDLAHGNNSDRPWVSQDVDGGLLVVWRDHVGGQLDGGGTLLVARSTDEGTSWSAAIDATPEGPMGPIVASSATLFLPHARHGVLSMATSPDHGHSWTDHAVATIEGPTVFPIAAVDHAGSVYVTWAEGSPPQVFLSVSQDDGTSWATPRLVSTPRQAAVFPWIAAGAAGRIAMSWYEERPGTGAVKSWDVRLAESTHADSPNGTFVSRAVNDMPVHTGEICATGINCMPGTTDRSLGDLFELRILPDGFPILAYGADSPAHDATVQVMATRITAGTSLLG